MPPKESIVCLNACSIYMRDEAGEDIWVGHADEVMVTAEYGSASTTANGLGPLGKLPFGTACSIRIKADMFSIIKRLNNWSTEELKDFYGAGRYKYLKRMKNGKKIRRKKK